jgi:hypothetical protein
MLAVPTVRLRKQLLEVSTLIDRTVAAAGEVELAARARKQLAATQQVVEGSVEGLNTIVGTTHQAIADVAFGVLEDISGTRDTAHVARAVHDTISGGVYGGISAINRLIGEGLRDQLKPTSAQPIPAQAEPEPLSGEAQPPGDERTAP